MIAIRQWANVPSRWVPWAMAALWMAALAYSSLTARVLFGDGGFYVLLNLQAPLRFNDYDFQRTFASVISQAPVLFGERMGVESVSIYAALYALGIFVLPALLMLWALFLVRRQPLLFAAIGLAIVVYGFGTSFINTEANLLFGFVWLAVAILGRERESPFLRGLALPLLGVAMLRTYEGMLLVGPVLAAWSVLAQQRSQSPQERVGLGIASLLFLLGAVIGFGGFLAPRDPGNAAGFVSTVFAYLVHPHVFSLASAVAAVLAMLAKGRAARIAWACASVLLGAIHVAGIFRIEGYYSFDVYYNNRSFMVLALPAFVAVLLAVYWRRAEWLAPVDPPAAQWTLLIPLAFTVAGDAVGTWRWTHYVNAFCDVLEVKASPEERVALLSKSGLRTAWRWTHPALSALLRDRGSNAVVANEPHQFGWQPFEPANTPVLPYRGLCQAPLLGRAAPGSSDLSAVQAGGAPRTFRSATPDK